MLPIVLGGIAGALAVVLMIALAIASLGMQKHGLSKAFSKMEESALESRRMLELHERAVALSELSLKKQDETLQLLREIASGINER